MKRDPEFYNLYRHGFIRTATCIPELKVSDPRFNAKKTLALIREAHAGKAVLAVFPELGISAYSNEDLFFQEALLSSVKEALGFLLDATKDIDMACIVGAPIKIEAGLYNCAIVMHKGRIAGIGVKSFLPNYREFYEVRQFRPAHELPVSAIDLCGCTDVPIGADLIFRVPGIPGMSLFVEICEDLWAPIPPSSFAAIAGATVMINLSASNITMGKDEYRHQLVANQSARLMAAYLCSAAGFGESTTDLAWDGQALVYENGTFISEAKRFFRGPQVVFADIDLGRLEADRIRSNTFHAGRAFHARPFRRIDIDLTPPAGEVHLSRQIPRFPYVPDLKKERFAFCCTFPGVTPGRC